MRIPICAVLGNHDLHCGQGDEIAALLTDAGVHMLDRSSTTFEIDGGEVGIVGTKGFVGGFTGSQLPDFGEPLLRQVYAETSDEAEAIRRGLQEVAHCPIRIVLLHYSPTSDTLHGEPEGIWTFLGSDRLATPIAEYRPDVVLHGHAHAGSFEGAIGTVPVYNVAVHVTGRDFYVFELEGHGLVHPDEVALERTGVAANRRFHIVDEEGRRYNQIRNGELVQIKPEYDA